MAKEELIMKVDESKGTVCLLDSEGLIGKIGLNQDFAKRKISLERLPDSQNFVPMHKIICFRYNLFPNLKEKKFLSYEEVLKTPLEEPTTDWGEEDSQAKMSYFFDRYVLSKFIQETNAERRIDLRCGKDGPYWLLNLRILNPAKVEIE